VVVRDVTDEASNPPPAPPAPPAAAAAAPPAPAPADVVRYELGSLVVLLLPRVSLPW
jgi:hypothetical protein